eukprot:CFRG6200T1
MQEDVKEEVSEAIQEDRVEGLRLLSLCLLLSMYLVSLCSANQDVQSDTISADDANFDDWFIGLAIGIVCVVLVLALVIAIIAIYCCRKQNKKLKTQCEQLKLSEQPPGVEAHWALRKNSDALNAGVEVYRTQPEIDVEEGLVPIAKGSA